MDERMNGRKEHSIHEWLKEWMEEKKTGLMNLDVKKKESINEWMKEWMEERKVLMNGRKDVWKKGKK